MIDMTLGMPILVGSHVPDTNKIETFCREVTASDFELCKSIVSQTLRTGSFQEQLKVISRLYRITGTDIYKITQDFGRYLYNE